MASVFDHDDYREYLEAEIHSRPRKGWGEKSRIAQAANCQSAYVTQVLSGRLDFSLEQAFAITRYLELTEEERHFFLLLVELSRAGSQGLQTHYRTQIEQIRKKRIQLSKRLKEHKEISVEDQAIYYSEWIYAAIHVLTSIPNYQTLAKISQALMIPREKVAEVLEFLCQKGYAERVGDRFEYKDASLHLSDDSPFVGRHHANWRMQAIRSLDSSQKRSDAELHYSSAVSVSKKDVPLIRDELVKAIEKVRKRVRESKEETLVCYCLDLFEMV